MNVQAFLCDAATVRENLLHVLGGGITRLWRQQVPAAMNIDLAMLLRIHPAEAGESHQLRIRIMSSDGAAIEELDAEFGAYPDSEPDLDDPARRSPGRRKPGEDFIFPLAVPLREVVVPSYGDYSVELLVDAHHVGSLFFIVAPPAGVGEVPG